MKIRRGARVRRKIDRFQGILKSILEVNKKMLGEIKRMSKSSYYWIKNRKGRDDSDGER
ncbi:hypothetical protein FACS1894187_10870 [Synergistales bacterium]|nr:hypothetical protein FACS1894187_10870 [Synergistales bacterium]